MLKFIKLLLLSISIILLFTTISLGTFTPDSVNASSDSDEFQPISIIDSILDEYGNNVDDDVVKYEDNYDAEDDNEETSSGLTHDSLRPYDDTEDDTEEISSSYKPYPVKTHDDSSVDEISTMSLKITSLIQTIGVAVSIFILLPICLILGIIYMVKSKSSKAKFIGFIIISIPILLFIISYMIPFFYELANM
ncbi:MAG: hypothetical protein E7310_01690 [Clostridiales bacterium]|nr:hypothetical protein [Clostridiales bacterium]